jgi:para-nitrobenzyl esterase
MWRRSLICFTLIMAMFVVSIQSADCHKKKKDKGLVRETAYGLVEGYKHSKKSYGWLGLPFAMPPVGELRWKAPKDPESWDGVRDAGETAQCDACTQVETDMWSAVPDPDEPGQPSIIGSEDCLYLNVFAPKKAKKLPVYVYFHGGSNRTGGTAEYTAANLAEKEDIVFVAATYRVGPLGWFYHRSAQDDDYTAEDNSGHYGNLDTIQAMKWVQENIEAFGGDPDNVTVGGTSAGAHDVIILMASPLAEGLFHRARIKSQGMSNDGNGVITYTPETGSALADSMLKALLGLDDEGLAAMTPAEIAAAAAQKSGAEIILAMAASGSPLYDAVVDGYVLPKDYFELFNEGDYNKVPVMVGVSEYETKPFLRYYGPAFGHPWHTLFDEVLVNGTMTMDELFTEFYGPLAEDGKNLYEMCGYYGGLNWNAKHLNELATILADQQPGEVYGFVFKWGGVGSGPEPFDFIIGPGHAFDTPLWQGWDHGLFGMSFTKENEKGRKATQKALMAYLAEFAKTGDPNKKGKKDDLIEWEPWSNEDGGPKALEIDADFKHVYLNMSNETVTFAEVEAALEVDKQSLPLAWQWLPGYFMPYNPYVAPEDRP